MTGYIQIQTYATCDKRNTHTFISIIERFRDTLQRLGCKDEQVLEWFLQISWPSSDDDGFGDIYASSFELNPEGSEPITCAGVDVSLYIQSAVPSIDEPPAWVGLNLLFDADQLKANLHSTYKKGVGKSIWKIMQELATTFREVGVYLTDDWQSNHAWRALVEQSGDPWIFDLGIFPRQHAERFAMIPSGFQGTVIEGDFGFAQENRWDQLPWKDDSSS